MMVCYRLWIVLDIVDQLANHLANHRFIKMAKYYFFIVVHCNCYELGCDNFLVLILSIVFCQGSMSNSAILGHCRVGGGGGGEGRGKKTTTILVPVRGQYHM